MTSSSSTSNSEPPFEVGAVPWALLLAILVLVGVEWWVRGQEPRDLIPYENTGRDSYSAVRNYVAAYGAAEVSFLGSSRGREAIAIPDIDRALRESLGREVTVANYSSPAASADECEQIIRIMLRENEGRPTIVLYGLTQLQLAKEALKTTHTGELWYIEDWWREKKVVRNRPVLGFISNYQYDLVPEALRLNLERLWKTFAYRNQLSFLAREWWDEYTPATCPVRGELSDSQTRKPDVSLLTRRIRARAVSAYMSKRMEGERYPLGPRQVANLRSVVRQCQEANVTLVLYEIPVSKFMRDALPAGTIEEFRRLTAEVADHEGVPFVRVEQLGITFGAADFRDISHLNLQGATKLSAALTERVILPQLKGEHYKLAPAGVYAAAYDDSDYPPLVEAGTRRRVRGPSGPEEDDDNAAADDPDEDF